MDGISMRDVVECLRGVSHEELLSNLSPLGSTSMSRTLSGK